MYQYPLQVFMIDNNIQKAMSCVGLTDKDTIVYGIFTTGVCNYFKRMLKQDIKDEINRMFTEAEKVTSSNYDIAYLMLGKYFCIRYDYIKQYATPKGIISLEEIRKQCKEQGLIEIKTNL